VWIKVRWRGSQSCGWLDLCGLDLCVPHECHCGSMVDARESARKPPGRTRCHSKDALCIYASRSKTVKSTTSSLIVQSAFYRSKQSVRSLTDSIVTSPVGLLVHYFFHKSDSRLSNKKVIKTATAVPPESWEKDFTRWSSKQNLFIRLTDARL